MKNLRLVTAIAFIAAGVSVFFGVSVRPAAAHPMPDSQVMLDMNRSDVGLALHVPLIELEVAYGKPLSQDPSGSITRNHDALAAYFGRHIVVLSPDGRPWQVTVNDVERGADGTPPFWQQATPYVDAHVTLTPPPHAPVRRFTLHYDVVVHQLLTHVALVSVRHDWNNGIVSDNPVILGELRVFNTSFPVDIPAGNPLRGFLSVVRLGMRHIAEGTDHLLFLLVLLLPASLFARNGKWAGYAGARPSTTRLLKIVTAFTVGHSMTLIAGALGWFRPPGQIVEALIAVSIFVSATHALRPIFPGREFVVAGGFGLIHGMAFAGVIAEFGLDAWHMALAIFGFNVGIELMQLVVVGLTVPWLLLLARTRIYPVIRIGGAAVAGIAALGWFGERAFGWPNPIGPWVERAASHALFIVAALAITAVGAALQQRLHSVKNPPVFPLTALND